MTMIKDFLVTKDYMGLKQQLKELNTFQIVDYMEETDENLLVVFRLLDKDMAAEVFSYLSPEKQVEIIEGISDDRLKNILDELYMDDIVDFLEEVPTNVVKRIIQNCKPENRVIINHFLAYEEESAGSLMTIEYLSLKKEWTVLESIYYIRKKVKKVETLDVAYVVDKNRKLEGLIYIKDLLMAEDEERIEEIMEKNIYSVYTTTNQEVAMQMFKKYDLTVLPVIDRQKLLVGIITIDDIVDIIEEENTEDFQKMAAMAPSKEEYLKTSVFDLAKNRLLWLLVLMISATFTGGIINRYEDILQSMVVLAASIPMLMDTGGNAGSQSSTLIIRGMALGEIEIKDYWKVIWKELRVSLIVGTGLGALNFARMFFILKNSMEISFLVSITLGLTIILAKLVGGVLPIGAKKLNLDPAIMAGPLVTTIVDALALIMYFYLAMIIFKL
ncbi:magnesium transporter [Cetobacterium sp. SF1]|uniref:magnesium transporter n=1 Tax=unclassified Cetobacterium TaxID=2630983 RepID=UPI003CE7D835